MLRATCSLSFDCIYSSKPTKQLLLNCALSEYCGHILPECSAQCVNVLFATSYEGTKYGQKWSAGACCKDSFEPPKLKQLRQVSHMLHAEENNAVTATTATISCNIHVSGANGRKGRQKASSSECDVPLGGL